MRIYSLVFLSFAGLLYASVDEIRQFELQKERVEQAYETIIDETSIVKLKKYDEVVDTFTQTEGFLSLQKMRDLITKHYNVVAYQAIIDDALEREQLYKNSHYVFYHGTDSAWRVSQDLYMQLYAYFKDPKKAIGKSFLFLRFNDESNSGEDATDFLLRESYASGLINDHILKEKLLSVNFSLFANTGSPGECSWQFFFKSRGHIAPTKEVYEKILDKFGVARKYIPQLIALEKLYKTQEEMLIQIFVPQYYVDHIGYVAWIRGIPAHPKLIAWIMTAVKNKKFKSNGAAMDYLAKKFKQERENNPLFAEMIGAIKDGDFALDAYLHTYRNEPQQLSNINRVIGQLILGTDVLLNPVSGVKFFRYSTATQQQLDKYHQQLNKLVDTMIREKAAF